ncbi:MAG: nuclear transport factor 2 family protein [Rhodobacter sp.]|nr:nuclear transport factor 2 family protein [Paracoccaceae bacterium]MCC0077934.1 nuclear transport factor 2 family protein [Rhodobacter sp.]
MPDSLLTALLECETRVWEALVAGDAAADAAALAEGFLGVYPDGFSGKAAHIAQLAAGPTVTRYRLDQARVLALTGDLAMLVYRAEYLRVGHEAAEVMYVSSLWRRRGAGWENLFSQDTPAGQGVP